MNNGGNNGSSKTGDTGDGGDDTKDGSDAANDSKTDIKKEPGSGTAKKGDDRFVSQQQHQQRQQKKNQKNQTNHPNPVSQPAETICVQFLRGPHKSTF